MRVETAGRQRNMNFKENSISLPGLREIAISHPRQPDESIFHSYFEIKNNIPNAILLNC
jgi:hypothetical protein